MARKKKVEEPKSEIIEMLEEQPIELVPEEKPKEPQQKREMIGLRPLRKL